MAKNNDKSFYEVVRDDPKKAKIGVDILNSASGIVAAGSDSEGGDLASSTLSGTATGLSTAAGLTALGASGMAAGIAGGGIGLAMMAVSYMNSRKARKAAEERMAKLRRQWQAGLQDYKRRVGKLKAGTEQNEKLLQKEKGNLFSLTKEALKEEQLYQKLIGKLATGVTSSSTNKQRASAAENREADILAKEDNAIRRLDLLDSLQESLDKERDARRDTFSNYKTAEVDVIDTKINELKELENEG